MLKKLLLGLAGILGVPLALIVIFFAIAYFNISSRQNKVYNLPESALQIDMSKADLSRGQHLVVTLGGCADCHATDLGGMPLMDDPSLGRIYGANLTSGKGGTADFSDADWVRAIRYGLNHNNQSLMIMPSMGLNVISDEDLASVVAYLKSLPPVDREQPANEIGPLLTILSYLDQLALFSAERVNMAVQAPQRVIPTNSAEYGHYVVQLGNCADCHGLNLAGGSIPGATDAPPAPNLTPGGALGGWTQADFDHAVTQGITPSGRELSPYMPYRLYKDMDAVELEAIWLYLQSLERLPSNP